MRNLTYKNHVLYHLFMSQQLSCMELSERLNKSFPLVNKLLVELVASDVIYEKGLADSTGGRRPVTYAIKPGKMFILAVSVDQRYTRIALVDMEHKIVSQPIEYGLTLKDNHSALNNLCSYIEHFIENSGIEKNKIIGIGIGIPGFIDPAKGINYTFFDSQCITSQVAAATGIRTFIDNDSSVIALAELKFGTTNGNKNVMVINISWGVGLGIIVEGNLYRGENGFAGEFSHIPLFNNNKLCSCGKTGCLETEASLQVIVDKAAIGIKEKRSTSLTLSQWHNDYEKDYSEVIGAAARGDQFAIQLFSEVGYNIGRGVAILVHLLNPGVIVLSGRGASAGKILNAPIQQALNTYCIPRLSEGTEICISELGEEAEIIGAAALVMENLMPASGSDFMLELPGVVTDAVGNN